jgi:PTH1 family peptidyl-tRNA hydrolase
MSAFSRRLGGEGRKGTPADYLVIGLGNPGDQFDGTRHNLGADIVHELASRLGTPLKKSKSRALVAGVLLGDKRVVLACPLTFMNNSGEAVRALAKSYGIQEANDIVVVHDELDLDVGRLRLKAGGGLAGHNGLRSITQHLGTTEYTRLRVGIGKPPPSQEVSEYVLRRPSKADRELLDAAVVAGADAVELLVEAGVDGAMMDVNRRNKSS